MVYTPFYYVTSVHAYAHPAMRACCCMSAAIGT